MTLRAILRGTRSDPPVPCELDAAVSDGAALRAWVDERLDDGRDLLLFEDETDWWTGLMTTTELAGYLRLAATIPRLDPSGMRSWAQKAEVCIAWMRASVVADEPLRQALAQTIRQALEDGGTDALWRGGEHDAESRLAALADLLVDESVGRDGTAWDETRHLSRVLIVGVVAEQARVSGDERVAALVDSLFPNASELSIVAAPAAAPTEGTSRAMEALQGFRHVCEGLASRSALFAVALAKKAHEHEHLKIPFLNAVWACQRGLLSAAATYDWEKSFRYDTYAGWFGWQAMGCPMDPATLEQSLGLTPGTLANVTGLPE